MSRTLNTEVLVVGAGPSGLMTGLALAEAGVRVTVIDREQRPAARSYACGLHPGSLRLLQRLGLLDSMLAEGRRLTAVGLYSPAGVREAEVSLATLPAEFPFVLVIPQDKLEARLVARLAELDCQVLWHHRLASLDPAPDGVRAEVDQLVGTGTGYIVPRWEWMVGRTIAVRAAFVVGADGHHSTVRQALGVENERVAPPEHYAVYEFEPEAALPDELRLVLAEGAKAVLWPLPDRRCRWSFLLPGWEATEFAEKDRETAWGEAPEVAQRTRQRLEQRLAAHAPWFSKAMRLMDWAADIQFQFRLARQYGRGRCWLVGDAAHQTAPAGIQSMNMGLLEAEQLAGKLVQILRGDATEAVLSEYEQAGRGEWERLLGVRGAPQAGSTTTPWVARHARQILTSLPASGGELDRLLGQLGLRLP